MGARSGLAGAVAVAVALAFAGCATSRTATKTPVPAAEPGIGGAGEGVPEQVPPSDARRSGVTGAQSVEPEEPARGVEKPDLAPRPSGGEQWSPMGERTSGADGAPAGSRLLEEDPHRGPRTEGEEEEEEQLPTTRPGAPAEPRMP